MALLHYRTLGVNRPDVLMQRAFYGLRTFYNQVLHGERRRRQAARSRPHDSLQLLKRLKNRK